MGTPQKIVIYYDKHSCNSIILLVDGDGNYLAVYSNKEDISNRCNMERTELLVDEYVVGGNFYIVNNKFIFYIDGTSCIDILSDDSNYLMEMSIDVNDYLKELFNNESY